MYITYKTWCCPTTNVECTLRRSNGFILVHSIFRVMKIISSLSAGSLNFHEFVMYENTETNEQCTLRAILKETWIRTRNNKIYVYTVYIHFGQNATNSIRIFFILKISLDYKNRAHTAFDWFPHIMLLKRC